jgi:hypothetical protein
MKMISATAASLSVIFCLEVFVATVARSGAAGYEARIGAECVAGGNAVDISLICAAPADGTVQYEMRVTRDGAGGRSAIRQSGTGKVAAGKVKVLSRARIGVFSGDRCVVDFEVSAGGNPVSRGTVELPGCSPESMSPSRHREESGEKSFFQRAKWPFLTMLVY